MMKAAPPGADNIVSLWEAQLISNKAGPKPILANVITGLRLAPEWRGILQFDDFKQRTILNGRAPWMREAEQREWRGADDICAAEWFQRKGVTVPPNIVAQGIDVVSRESTVHPVCAYLAALEWDGVLRLDTWAVRYLGAEDTPYVRAVSAKWMISAVARVCEPGCKADCALILEGPQGIMKSTAVSVLGGDWFTDEVAEFGNKDASMQVSGAWVIEIAELDAMSKAEVHKVKAFMSRRIDRFRPPYGIRVEEFPRQCVFVGTVNMTEYLRDETGGRRFWPLACGRIDIDGLRAVRDQLWAEAKHRYLDGESWWLDDPETVTSAKDEQRARYQEDVWQALIAEHLIGSNQTSIPDILSVALGVSKDKWSQTDQNRVARCLRLMGWERRQSRDLTGRRGWVYMRPSVWVGEVGADEDQPSG